MVTAHEIIHVYLTYLYTENQLLTVYPNYSNLNEAFLGYENNTVTPEELALEMHAVYNDFIGLMTASVFDYATKNNITGATEEYCNKLVIGAHEETSTFQSLNETNQTNYSTISTNEQNGTEDAKGSNCE